MCNARARESTRDIPIRPNGNVKAVIQRGIEVAFVSLIKTPQCGPS